MTSPDICHPAIPADVPGKINLDQFSLDRHRSYGAEHHRIAEAYKATAAELTTSMALYDVTGDPGELQRAGELLGTLRGLGEQAGQLDPPNDLKGARAELDAFSSDVYARANAVGRALARAGEHSQLKADQAERAAILKRNKEAGLPFHHSLPDRLLTSGDADVIPGYWEKMSAHERNHARINLRRQEKRLASDTTFNLASTVTAEAENADVSAQIYARARRASAAQRANRGVQSAEPAPKNGAWRDAGGGL